MTPASLAPTLKAYDAASRLTALGYPNGITSAGSTWSWTPEYMQGTPYYIVPPHDEPRAA